MNYCEENTETCKFVELNGCKLCCFENGHIYRVMPNGDMRYCKGSLLNNGYLSLMCKYKRFLHHRIIGYAFLGLDIQNTSLQIDHINHIQNDNRVNNLRIVTPQENKFNNFGKGYRLVGNKWQARLRFNCKDIHLGYFKTEEEARNAYLEGKSTYHIIPNNN
jgi:hypothetical protein